MLGTNHMLAIITVTRLSFFRTDAYKANTDAYKAHTDWHSIFVPRISTW